MATEEAFIAAIVAAPEDDAHRLVFSDWLEENGQPDCAELIRAQCRLEPVRDEYEDDEVNASRKRVEDLLRPISRAENLSLRSLLGPEHAVKPEWRRGFVETLLLPVRDLLRHGAQLRDRYPVLRKLVLFRLNGWGERAGRCESLRGIRELDLPCWYSDDDARALAESPHLGDVERVVSWSGGGIDQARILAGSDAWPELRNLHLVAWEEAEAEGWVEAVDEAAGRPIGSVHVVENELFPIAADFDEEGHYIVGKLSDGTQLFMMAYLYDDRDSRFEGVAFDEDGTPRPERFLYPLPSEIDALMREAVNPGGWEKWRQALKVRDEYLRQELGFQPAMIRVQCFEFHSIWGISRLSADAESSWGRLDPEEPAPRDHPLGRGGWVYSWVTDGMYQMSGGNSPWCDASGHISST